MANAYEKHITLKDDMVLSIIDVSIGLKWVKVIFNCDHAVIEFAISKDNIHEIIEALNKVAPAR